ncbi:extracellular solute-binding protein [Streptomyces sp. NRRL S-378]|uniref:extracellular solute-binding protein n=1 Tax=Streptomyces sp. NRRL S-378 TaxID=1463904 RepID=UPI00055C4146|nr:extracellular solute-binding protein [Streptomyces sp. NRRL S-378]
MRRRIFGTTATASVLGLLIPLAGCGGSGDGAGGDGTLQLVAAEYGDSPATSSKPFWDKVTADFTEENPGIKVEVKLLPWADIDREVSRMVKAGKAPDMALMGSYSDFAARGELYAADELLPVTAEANFLQPLADAGSVGSTLYGLPFVASSRLLFYNEALFAKAGVKEAPRTWSDLKAAAKALKDKGVKYPYALPLGPEEAHAEGMLNGYPSLAHEARAKGINVVTTTMPVSDDLGTGETPPTVGVADWMMAFKQNGKRAEIGKFLDFVYQDRNLTDFASRYHLLPSTVTASRTPAGGGLDKNDQQFLNALRGAQLYPVNDPSWVTVSDTIKRNIGRAVEPTGNPKGVLEDIAAQAAQASKKH